MKVISLKRRVMQLRDPPKQKKLNPRRAQVKLLPPMNTARKYIARKKGGKQGDKPKGGIKEQQKRKIAK